MTKKPLIGLSPSFYEHKEMDRSILGKSYTDNIQKAGGLPVLIPPIIDKQDLSQLLRRLDGVVLTGGDDLDPTYYGEQPGPKTPKVFHPRRGLNDKQIFEYAWENKLPTLAICLGFQEANVFLGGSLYQDIPSQYNDPIIHKTGDWFDARHQVQLEAGSLLHHLTGKLSVETNSAHHQAIKTVADQLKIGGRTEDGIIEVLEPRDASIPLLGVQWHPESETNDVVGINLLKWLVKQSADRASISA
ncbi:MAG: gamma-glutamyl-gamma-aminobutyrate hydrolase family protein [Candidatus Marinimicrobia bacterium]|nr:gamma-glutamyl-gamma-aminobutyrate hydrolase family protein [Candidatus Neomarinimicrobiota bacterium]